MYRTQALDDAACSPASAPPTDTNERFHELTRDGRQTGSRPPSTCRPCSASTPTTRWRCGEVGRCGVAIDSLADVGDLFAGIDLGAITTSMTINSPAAVMLAMFVAEAEKAGVDRARLSAARSRTTS